MDLHFPLSNCLVSLYAGLSHLFLCIFVCLLVLYELLTYAQFFFRSSFLTFFLFTVPSSIRSKFLCISQIIYVSSFFIFSQTLFLKNLSVSDFEILSPTSFITSSFWTRSSNSLFYSFFTLLFPQAFAGEPIDDHLKKVVSFPKGSRPTTTITTVATATILSVKIATKNQHKNSIHRQQQQQQK